MGRIEHGKTGDQTGADMEMVDAALERMELVYIEAEPGDALFFHCNLLHRSDQNRSPNPRWSLICCYNAARNNPYKESRHPRYSPLAKVADAAIKHWDPAAVGRLVGPENLRPELSLITEHRERFLREARAVNRINHENIVEITDVGESDGIAYLVMEFVEGESLLVHDPARPRSLAARAAHRHAGRERARARAPDGRHPSRPQAREHPPREARTPTTRSRST